MNCSELNNTSSCQMGKARVDHNSLATKSQENIQVQIKIDDLFYQIHGTVLNKDLYFDKGAARQLLGGTTHQKRRLLLCLDQRYDS